MTTALEQLRMHTDAAAAFLAANDVALAKESLVAARTILTILGASVPHLDLTQGDASYMLQAMRCGLLSINGKVTTPTRIKINNYKERTCLHVFYREQWPGMAKGHNTIFDTGVPIPGGEG